ncbi:MAG: hypothetical protein ACRDIW_01990 [Actinomycetota bacterium]
MTAARRAQSRSRFDALIEEATTDCKDEEEAISGFLTMMADNLAVSFQTEVLGVEVTVQDVGLNGAGEIVATCSRGNHRQRIQVVDLPLPAEAPEGADGIEAYRLWRS